MDVITIEQIPELRKVANYRSVRKTCRQQAFYSIVLGVMSLFWWIGALQNPINVIMLLIAVFLLVEGIWLLVSPRPAVILMDGIALCILGAWIVFATIVNLAVGGFGMVSLWLLVGLSQIGLGFYYIRWYHLFSAVPFEKASEETVRRVDELAKSVTKLKPSESNDVIQFTGGGDLWYGMLGRDVGIFAGLRTNELLIAGREEVHIVRKGSGPVGKKVKALVRIGKRPISVSISPEFMQRYELWKAASR